MSWEGSCSVHGSPSVKNWKSGAGDEVDENKEPRSASEREVGLKIFVVGAVGPCSESKLAISPPRIDTAGHTTSQQDVVPYPRRRRQHEDRDLALRVKANASKSLKLGKRRMWSTDRQSALALVEMGIVRGPEALAWRFLHEEIQLRSREMGYMKI